MKRISWIILICCFLASQTGCKLILSFAINKDWAVDSHPLNSEIYHPDLKTNAEIRLEHDFDKPRGPK